MSTAEGTSTVPGSAEDWHDALFYRGQADYVDGVGGFTRTALAQDRPILLALPPDKLSLMADDLAGFPGRVSLADMAEVGRNPNRIIPAIQRFLDEHAGEAVSFVGEPIWPGRSQAEIAEATRHEALINHAFGGGAARVLCPYDLGGLDAEVVADAARTHPHVRHAGSRFASSRFEDPVEVWSAVSHLPPAPAGAETMPIELGALGRARALARRHAGSAGLPPERTEDLMLAVTEVATNTLVHSGGSGTLTMWTDEEGVVCETRDAGRLRDPLAGRRRPSLEGHSGRGLWMVNSLTDLVQLHSDDAGTCVRLRVSRRPLA